MNLALLDPFRRQIPDRIDSTLTIPRNLLCDADTADHDDDDDDDDDNPSSSSLVKKEDGEKAPDDVVSAVKKKKKKRRSSGDDLGGGGGTGDSSDDDSDDDDGKQEEEEEVKKLEEEETSKKGKKKKRGLKGKKGKLKGDKTTKATKKGKVKSLPTKKSKGKALSASKKDEKESNVVSTSSTSASNQNTTWSASYAVSFNRRGTYLAAGHASGSVPIHDFVSRTLSALYRHPYTFSSGNSGRSSNSPRSCLFGVYTKDAKPITKNGLVRIYTKDDENNKRKNETEKDKNDEEEEEMTLETDEVLPDEAPSSTTMASSSATSTIGTIPKKKKKKKTKRSKKSAPDSQEDNDDDDDETNEKEEEVEFTATPKKAAIQKPQLSQLLPLGVTSLTWSRRSRTLLVSSVGDFKLRLVDNTHPFGPEDCLPPPTSNGNASTNAAGADGGEKEKPEKGGGKRLSTSSSIDIEKDDDEENELSQQQQQQQASSSAASSSTTAATNTAGTTPTKKRKKKEEEALARAKNAILRGRCRVVSEVTLLDPNDLHLPGLTPSSAVASSAAGAGGNLPGSADLVGGDNSPHRRDGSTADIGSFKTMEERRKQAMKEAAMKAAAAAAEAAVEAAFGGSGGPGPTGGGAGLDAAAMYMYGSGGGGGNSGGDLEDSTASSLQQQPQPPAKKKVRMNKKLSAADAAAAVAAADKNVKAKEKAALAARAAAGASILPLYVPQPTPAPPVMDKSMKERHEAALKRMQIDNLRKTKGSSTKADKKAAREAKEKEKSLKREAREAKAKEREKNRLEAVAAAAASSVIEDEKDVVVSGGGGMTSGARTSPGGGGVGGGVGESDSTAAAALAAGGAAAAVAAAAAVQAYSAAHQQQATAGKKQKQWKTKKQQRQDARILKRSPPPPRTRYQTLLLPLPSPIGGPAVLHPHDGYAGLACLADGSLCLFRFPPAAYYEVVVPPKSAGAPWVDTVMRSEREKKGRMIYVVPPPQPSSSDNDGEEDRPKKKGGKEKSSKYFITCASFDKDGSSIYAATKCGTLLAYRVPPFVMASLGSPPTQTIKMWQATHLSVKATTSQPIPTCPPPQPPSRVNTNTLRPSFRIKIPGGARAWSITVSRNGKLILVNSSDSALRLYDAEECWKLEAKEEEAETARKQAARQKKGEVSSSKLPPAVTTVKPRFVFQDLVSKNPWAACDFSGDGEYVVGGCNLTPQMGDKYELYLWNTSTGALLDQLTGPNVALHSLSWHPTRSFIAVGTSDGLVDIWGPRMDWTAFAPDFQALPMNVEYVEREDEFDVVVDGDEEEERRRKEHESKMEEDDLVDVVTVEKVPVFDSDSEDELDAFHFETKVRCIMPAGKRGFGTGSGASAGLASGKFGMKEKL